MTKKSTIKRIAKSALIASGIAIAGCQGHTGLRLSSMDYNGVPAQASYGLISGMKVGLNTDLEMGVTLDYTRMDEGTVHADNLEVGLEATYPVWKFGIGDVRLRFGTGNNRSNIQLPSGQDGVQDTAFYKAGASASVKLPGKLKVEGGIEFLEYDSDVEPKNAQRFWTALELRF